MLGTYADISLARAELGYDPSVSLEEGLQLTIDAYRVEREQQRVIDGCGRPMPKPRRRVPLGE